MTTPPDTWLSSLTQSLLHHRVVGSGSAVDTLPPLLHITQILAGNPTKYPQTLQVLFDLFALANPPVISPRNSSDDDTQEQQSWRTALDYAEWIDAFHASSGTWKLAQITGLVSVPMFSGIIPTEITPENMFSIPTNAQSVSIHVQVSFMDDEDQIFSRYSPWISPRDTQSVDSMEPWRLDLTQIGSFVDVFVTNNHHQPPSTGHQRHIHGWVLGQVIHIHSTDTQLVQVAHPEHLTSSVNQETWFSLDSSRLAPAHFYSGPRARFGLGGGCTPISPVTIGLVSADLMVVARTFAAHGGLDACLAAAAAVTHNEQFAISLLETLPTLTPILPMSKSQVSNLSDCLVPIIIAHVKSHPKTMSRLVRLLEKYLFLSSVPAPVVADAMESLTLRMINALASSQRRDLIQMALTMLDNAVRAVESSNNTYYSLDPAPTIDDLFLVDWILATKVLEVALKDMNDDRDCMTRVLPILSFLLAHRAPLPAIVQTRPDALETFQMLIPAIQEIVAEDDPFLVSLSVPFLLELYKAVKPNMLVLCQVYRRMIHDKQSPDVLVKAFKMANDMERIALLELLVREEAFIVASTLIPFAHVRDVLTTLVEKEKLLSRVQIHQLGLLTFLDIAAPAQLSVDQLVTLWDASSITLSTQWFVHACDKLREGKPTCLSMATLHEFALVRGESLFATSVCHDDMFLAAAATLGVSLLPAQVIEDVWTCTGRVDRVVSVFKTMPSRDMFLEAFFHRLARAEQLRDDALTIRLMDMYAAYEGKAVGENASGRLFKGPLLSVEIQVGNEAPPPLGTDCLLDDQENRYGSVVAKLDVFANISCRKLLTMVYDEVHQVITDLRDEEEMIVVINNVLIRRPQDDGVMLRDVIGKVVDGVWGRITVQLYKRRLARLFVGDELSKSFAAALAWIFEHYSGDADGTMNDQAFAKLCLHCTGKTPDEVTLRRLMEMGAQNPQTGFRMDEFVRFYGDAARKSPGKVFRDLAMLGFDVSNFQQQ